MFTIYRFLAAILFYSSLPILLAMVLITGKHRAGLMQRFGWYPAVRDKSPDCPLVWLHAASVGEVQAARPIIDELRGQMPQCRIVLTTMTMHGRRVAEEQLDSAISCYLAPLDVPLIVEHAIARLKPDFYICIETELWPVLLDALARRKVRLCLANGRISARSFGKYRRMEVLMRHVVRLFHRMAVISDRDRMRYISLGADPQSVTTEGNVKYDLVLPPHAEDIRESYRKRLHLDGEEVLIAGSTHGGEEAKLLDVFAALTLERRMYFIIAPRHVERIPDIEELLRSRQINSQLYSDIKRGCGRQRESVLLVDTMGELAQLYSIADYVFCGGSLVNKGGHNLMEAAVWDRAVFFGPYVDDFHDAAELLENCGGGFRVKDAAALADSIREFRSHADLYTAACRRAGDVARAQQGSSGRQVAYLLQDRP